MFEVPVNKGLMHLALIRQQSNRRHSIAHVKHRGEVVGSTKKMFQQKGTGRARRGPGRSPLLKGGGKAFGPRNESNFVKDMPKKMRRAALFSCLSLKASEGAIIGLESYPDDVKTKSFMALIKKLPVEFGRRITLVLPGHHRGLELSARNVPRVKTLLAGYLNPEDVLGSQKIVFVADSIKVAEKMFLSPSTMLEKKVAKMKKADEEGMVVHTAAVKKTAAKKATERKAAAERRSGGPKKAAKPEKVAKAVKTSTKKTSLTSPSSPASETSK